MLNTSEAKTPILHLAKIHLNLSPSASAASIPPVYIDELKKHLAICPDDTNYRVTLEPGKGFGKVTCLESGCESAVIPLTKRAKVRDGGRKDGLGSLSAYRFHIESHRTHKQQRLARVKAAQAERRSTLPATTSHSAPIKASSSSDPFQGPAVTIKSEPAESSIPRKRASDVAFSSRPPIKTEPSLELLPTQPPPSKKLKRELNGSKKPLSTVDSNSFSDIQEVANMMGGPPSSPTAPLAYNYLPPMIKEDVPRSLHDINCLAYSVPFADIDQQDNFTVHVKPERKREVSPFLYSSQCTTPVASRSGSIMSPPGNDKRPEPDDYKDLAMHVDDQAIDIGPNVATDKLTDSVVVKYRSAIPSIDTMLDNRDENGDFHGRGRDTFQGPQAAADDIDKFLIAAGNSEQFDGNASVDRALEKLGLTGQYQLLPGMQVALMPHQTIGVAWMVDKENSYFKGGCLGDEMGLGKTVQMIATIVKNTSTNPACKSNLIIAPTALLDQWKTEIEDKTNNGLKCLIYHGNNKPRRKKELLEYDIILTTYATMSYEWPDFENEQKRKKAQAKRRKSDGFIVDDSDEDESDVPKRRGARKEAGILFQVDWYRVVLDEAQSIRNKTTRASRAVSDLRATYRWCLTGTPIVNGLADVYGYFRFLKLRPWYDWSEFHGHIGKLERKNPKTAVVRLQAILATCMLRRVKSSQLDGKRLIDLPPKEIELVKLEFTQEERDIYKMVEARTQASFNRFLRAGTVLKNYHQVLVLLLRLRQICSHPSLIQEAGDGFVHPDEIDDDKPEVRTELSRARYLVSLDFVNKLKQRFKEAALKRIEAEKESLDATIEGDDCPICHEPHVDAVITPCSHIFCRECITNVISSPLAREDDEGFKLDERPCPSCRSPVCADKLFTRTAFEPSDEDLFPSKVQEADVIKKAEDPNAVFRRSSKKKNRRRSQKTDRTKRASREDDHADDCLSDEEMSDDDDDDMSDFIVNDSDEEDEEERRISKTIMRRHKKRTIVLDSENEMPEDEEVIFGQQPTTTPSVTAADGTVMMMPKFLPSTKMKYMMEILRELAKDHPDEKTIVVSQWTSCLSLVSNYLSEAGVAHVKYQGDMERHQRDQAVRVFMTNENARVMLMSLKCGGVGLNLTRANNVISLDLGWSQAVEAQAFDRCHRLGQMRTVNIQRLVIADTVEDRVLAMQERKQNLADGSLGEGNGKKIGKLTVRELANLFGLDARGRLLKT